MVEISAEGIQELMRKGLQKSMGLNNNQLEFAIKVRCIFEDIDVDGSGQLSCNELHLALAGMGVQLTMAEVQHYMQKYSTRDEINLHEFEDIVKDLVPPQEQDAGGLVLQARLKKMFGDADKDGSHGLDMIEIREGLSAVGLQITDAQLRRIFTLGDTNGDGVLDYEEFLALYSKHKNFATTEMTQYELELIDKRWEQRDEIVKDGDPDCKPGQKVMLRRYLRNRRGFQRLKGIGVLKSPEPLVGGRWFVKFPCAPEVFLSTGRRGVYELMYVRDDPSTGIDTNEPGHMAKFLKPDERPIPQSALLTTTVGDNYANVTSTADYEVCMDDFRFRLILARLTADPTVMDPRQQDKIKNDRLKGKTSSGKSPR